MIHFEITSNCSKAVDDFFKEMTVEEQKDIKALHDKIELLIKETEKLKENAEELKKREIELEDLIASLK